jgi:hypothetical protein
MTREEIVAMAREAGLENYGPTPSAPYSFGIFVDCVERFAALVERRAAAAEREACAKIAEEWPARVVAAAIRARGEKP